MLTVRDLMTPDPVTLDPELTLREAIDELSDAGVSGAPVVAAGRLVGVVSASDILTFHSSTPGVPSYREDRVEPFEAEGEELWEEDATEPLAAYFREMWADSAADLVERFAGPDGPEWDVLSEHYVAEVMTGRVLSLSPDLDVVEAARLMTNRRIHRVIIVEDGNLEGIVSAMDFVRAVAEGRLGPWT